jgi:hypothetical protein
MQIGKTALPEKKRRAAPRIGLAARRRLKTESLYALPASQCETAIVNAAAINAP